MAEELFATEEAYFEEHRQEFVGQALGKFALIRGKEDFGFFDSEEEAYRTGIELFGIAPFLIKEVLPQDRLHEIPAYYLGLTNAVL